MKTLHGYQSTHLALLALAICLPLASVLVSHQAHGTPPNLPRCDEGRSLDQVREALEAHSDRAVLGLYAVSETGAGADGDYRRCAATVVTSDGEAPIGFSIGWHDRRNGIPFWTGESL